MQLIRITRLLLIIPLIILIAACSKSPAEKALKELKQRNIAYTEDSFMEHVKSRQGDKAVVDLFLTARMSPDAKSKEGISALTFASRGGHAEIVTLLLAKGADVNAKDRDGNTALIIATMYRRAEIVSLLLAKGVDVNARNNAGYTALIFAKKYAYAQIADILEKTGATIPKESIEGLLSVAGSQWQEGDYQNALQNYQEILLQDPNNSKSKEFLNKYSAVELTKEEIAAKFKKNPLLNEFEQKRRAEEQKEFLARKETYFNIISDLEFAISKYDFEKKRYIITVGLREGKVGYSGMVVPETLFILNENGGRIELPLYMDEEKAASLKSRDKKEQKVLVIYKLKEVEIFTDIFAITPRGSAIPLENQLRRYIKPIYVALLTGNEKYVLYEEKVAEQAKQIKDYKKNIRKK